jgi:hypothetical protein
VDQMTGVLQRMGVDGGCMNEENLRNILNEFWDQFWEQMRPARVEDGVVVAAEAINQVEATRRYNVNWFQQVV